MKVLLSAYSCLPDAGSESGIGWNWAREIASCGHQVFVLTRAVNRASIAAACKRDAIQNPQFLFHDISPILQRLYSLPFGNYVYYCLWQYTAATFAAEIHRAVKFDQVQHITWGSFRLPSFMGRLAVPFIFGPVAGGEDTPKKLRKGLGLRGRVWDCLRRLSNRLLTRLPPMGETYSKAAQIVVTTHETFRGIPEPHRKKARVQQAVGVDERLTCKMTRGDVLSPPIGVHARLRLLFVGRLLPWKGLHLGLKALAELDSSPRDVHLTIVGSGSDKSRLKQLARRLAIDDAVSWIPWINREDLFRLYTEFDLFLFPSLHDSGGMAILEAMSFGLPVLCLDLGGPSISVDNTCGRVIATTNLSEKELVTVIASQLSRLLDDAPLLESLSSGARRRAAMFSWRAIIANTYDSAQVQVRQ